MKPGNILLSSIARALAAVGVLAGAALTGCGPGTAPGSPDGGAGMMADPRGGDATFSFSWRINGTDPTAANDVCRTAGVRFIRMTVVDAANVERRYDAFQFDCNLGHYRSTAPELSAGTFRFYWEAVSPEGARVSLASGNYVNGVLQPTLEQVTIVRGVHADFDATNHEQGFPAQPTNFSTGAGPLEVQIAWAQAAGATGGTECATAGVASLSWTLRLSNGVAVETHATREQCTAAYSALQWPRVNFDKYILDVRGFDAASQQLWTGRCVDLLAASPDVANARYRCVVDRRTP